jgi:hypothetical protein
MSFENLGGLTFANSYTKMENEAKRDQVEPEGFLGRQRLQAMVGVLRTFESVPDVRKASALEDVLRKPPFGELWGVITWCDNHRCVNEPPAFGFEVAGVERWVSGIQFDPSMPINLGSKINEYAEGLGIFRGEGLVNICQNLEADLKEHFGFPFRVFMTTAPYVEAGVTAKILAGHVHDTHDNITITTWMVPDVTAGGEEIAPSEDLMKMWEEILPPWQELLEADDASARAADE